MKEFTIFSPLIKDCYFLCFCERTEFLVSLFISIFQVRLKVQLNFNHYPKNLFLGNIFSCSIVERKICKGLIKTKSQVLALIWAENHVVFINLQIAFYYLAILSYNLLFSWLSSSYSSIHLAFCHLVFHFFSVLSVSLP